MSQQKLTFISKEKLLEMMTNKETFTLVEVLSQDSYKEGHLPAAINIPGNKIEELAAGQLPDKSAKIVVYCGSFTCMASTNAARKLQELGYTDVLDYKGGKKDWKDAGLSIVQE